MTLEQANSVAEQVELPPSEPGKPTEPGEKPTVKLEETPEFRRSLAKSTESLTRQFNLHKAAAESAQAELEQYKQELAERDSRIQQIEREHEEYLIRNADDPEAARRAYTDRKAIADEKRALAKREADLAKKVLEAEWQSWAGAKALKIVELRAQYQVPQEALDDCVTLEQMEKIAKHFPEVGEKESEKQPKFDSNLSTGGRSWRDLSPDEKIAKGLSQK